MSSGELDAPRAGSLSCVSWQRNKSAGAAFAGQRPHGVSLHARHLSEAQLRTYRRMAYIGPILRELQINQ